MPADFANVNELWARTISETLRAKGVRYAVICPGSRSSPLVFAFDRTEGVEAIPILDERSGAFFALGLVKRTGAPVAVVCTSGTAAANFFPAVIEASECGAPLAVLTADRPHELRDCRAGQTIRQVGLYGSYPVSDVELAIPTAELSDLTELRNTVADQVNCALSTEPGPVHLNIPFREPLAPIEGEPFASPIALSDLRSFCSETTSPERATVEVDLSDFTDSENGLILVGSPLKPISEAWVDNVTRLTDRLDWPVLADALNPIRNHSDRFPRLVTHYDLICRLPQSKGALLPDRVLVIGDLPISKALRNWMETNRPKSVFLAPLPGDFDSTHGNSETRYFDFDYGSPRVARVEASAFASEWTVLDGRVEVEMDRRLEECKPLFEGQVARALSVSLPRGSALFVSNSMPPRDMEFFWKRNDRGVEVHSSRGANGIDGILSTALGIAHRGKPTYLLTGDLALLHDSNGGLVSKVFEGSLTVVLVNNGGGGIFEMLPVRKLGDTFEKYFKTDQEVDFARWAATYGLAYERVDSISELRESVQRDAIRGVRVLEIVTDGKRDAETRRHWFREVADALFVS